jgi:hypothetical protein
LVGTRAAVAKVSDLSEEHEEGGLVEVLAGTFDAHGLPIVVEALPAFLAAAGPPIPRPVGDVRICPDTGG